DSRYGVYGESVHVRNDFPRGIVKVWDFKEGSDVATWNFDDVPNRGYFHPKSRRIYILLRRTGVVTLYY
ncbi:MAG: hypothetical protein ACP6IS_06475, partial [Candidatus Asgardarchaeia archaeon]